MTEVTERDPRTLKAHPANAEIYGDGPDAELIESVRAHGVLDPLLIVADGTVLWGHRRRLAAIEVARATVPCRVADVDPSDGLAVEELLLEGNRYREKTPEQRAREYERRKHIESERAKRRLAHGQTAPGRTPTKMFTEASKGEAGTKAAAAVGWSRPTAEKAVQVVKAADDAERRGDRSTADDLRRTLNGRGVEAAHKKATGRDTPYAAHGIPTKKAGGKKRQSAPARRAPPATSTALIARGSPPAQPPAVVPVLLPAGAVELGPTIEDVLNAINRAASVVDLYAASDDGREVNIAKATQLFRDVKAVVAGSGRRHVIAADVEMPPSLDMPECRQAVDAWLLHKRKRGESYKDAVQVALQMKRFADRTPGEFIAAVEYSIGQNYAGLYAEKVPAQATRSVADYAAWASNGEGHGD